METINYLVGWTLASGIMVLLLLGTLWVFRSKWIGRKEPDPLE